MQPPKIHIAYGLRREVSLPLIAIFNDTYAMLRARLPAEIPDDVVSLISYNPEAFADFASIENQEDVKSFNEKYGMELVIDVATV